MGTSSELVNKENPVAYKMVVHMNQGTKKRCKWKKEQRKKGTEEERKGWGYWNTGKQANKKINKQQMKPFILFLAGEFLVRIQLHANFLCHRGISALGNPKM